MFNEKNVISMQEKLKDVVFDELGELFYYADQYYGEYLLDLIDDFIEEKHQDDDLSSMMIPHFISWATLCHRVRNSNKTIFQHYLESPEYKSRRRPKVHRIISEWKYTMPGFYYVEEIAGERVLVVTDVFQMKEKLVAVYNEIYHLPREGDLIFGYLLPAGDGTYSPVIDFFHIPVNQKRDTAIKIIEFYNKKAVATDHEFFEKNYPKLLSLIFRLLQKK
ncbi:hypothetical protein V7201_07555 [Bacillus sp. JJ1122]|uniref:hypothetical protein n=1 Tax=Bacillus sp. JJ1122 TaxID=3122951 RepID=UPI002FFD611E